jgi:hypothetical protein
MTGNLRKRSSEKANHQRTMLSFSTLMGLSNEAIDYSFDKVTSLTTVL